MQDTFEERYSTAIRGIIENIDRTRSTTILDKYSKHPDARVRIHVIRRAGKLNEEGDGEGDYLLRKTARRLSRDDHPEVRMKFVEMTKNKRLLRKMLRSDPNSVICGAAGLRILQLTTTAEKPDVEKQAV